MTHGAEVVVRVCAGVREGEAVAIVTDEKRLPIARALESAVSEAGATPVIVLGPERSMDNEPPAEAVAAAMSAADVVLMPVTHSLSHTPATRRAVEGGAREARVTNPAGTDLRMSLDGRRGNSHSCVLDGPGFTAVPNIEANIAPAEGSGAGVLVADGSIPNFGIGRLRKPVRFHIGEGFVRSIEGGEAGRFLRELLAEQADPWVYNVAQFALGLNPECKDFTGEMLNDEGVDGTIHIGIGTSANLGGNVQAKTHFDAVIREPSVQLDGELILDRGEWAPGLEESAFTIREGGRG